MPRCPSRRDVMRAAANAAALGPLTLGGPAVPHAQTAPTARPPSRIDTLLAAAAREGDVPGVVAMAAADSGVVYEGAFGKRCLTESAAMTRDTVFRVASMVKLITSVAALQLVERGKLALDTPVPDLDPALGSPRVLDGFEANGTPRLRPPKRPIQLRDLLTHTAGFSYRLWDAHAVQYARSIDLLPAAARREAPRTALMFDPGEGWRYGTSIDWAGRIVEHASGERLDVYFRRNILDPLGMTDTAFVISPQQRLRQASLHRREPSSSLTPQTMERQQYDRRSFNGGGGIYSTAPDYLRLVHMLLRRGSLDGARILSPDTVALMEQNQIGDVKAGVMRTTAPTVSNDVDFLPGIRLRWSFGHMINIDPVADGRSAGSLTWAGLYNTYYWIDPARRIAAVFMTQVLPFADRRTLRIYRQFESAVYATVKSG